MNSKQINCIVCIRGLNNNKFNNKKPLLSKIKETLNSKQSYTIFTSIPPCESLLIFHKPISKISIDCHSHKELKYIHSHFLTDTSLFTYDHIYNESNKTESLYAKSLKDSITKMFQGINSFTFIYGPKDSGKSFTINGLSKNHNQIKGLMHYSLRTLLNLISIAKETQCDSQYNVILDIKVIHKRQCHDLLPIGSKRIIKSNKDLQLLLNSANLQRKTLSKKKQDKTSQSYNIITLSLIDNSHNEMKGSCTYIEVSSEDKSQVNSYLSKEDNIYNDIANSAICLKSNVLPDHYESSLFDHIIKNKIQANSLVNIICCVSAYNTSKMNNEEYYALNWLFLLKEKLLNIDLNDIIESNRREDLIKTNSQMIPAFYSLNLNKIPLTKERNAQNSFYQIKPKVYMSFNKQGVSFDSSIELNNQQQITNNSFEFVMSNYKEKNDLLSKHQVIERKYHDKVKEIQAIKKDYIKYANEKEDTISNLKKEIRLLNQKVLSVQKDYEKKIELINKSKEISRQTTVETISNNNTFSTINNLSVIEEKKLNIKLRLIQEFQRKINHIRKGNNTSVK